MIYVVTLYFIYEIIKVLCYNILAMKKTLFIILILCVFLTSFVLVGCGDKSMVTTDNAVLKMDSLLNEVSSKRFLTLDVLTTYNGKINYDYQCTYDFDYKYAEKVNRYSSEYYFSGMVAEKKDNKTLLKNYFSFDKILDDTIGLYLDFVTDKENFTIIKTTDSSIELEFLGKGAKYAFNGDVDYWKGVYKIYFDKSTLTKTEFFAETEVAGVKVPITSIINYSYPEKLWDTTPSITPDSSVIFGKYMVEQLKFANENKTFDPAVPDNKGGMGVIFEINDQIKSVSFIDAGDRCTLILNYSGKVINLPEFYNSTNVKKIEITYLKSNFAVAPQGVKINDNTPGYDLV